MPEKSDKQLSAERLQQEMMKTIEARLSPEEVGCFVAISSGFLQSRQDIDANVTSVRRMVDMGEAKLWKHSYKITLPALRTFSFLRPEVVELAGKMMSLQHGLAHIHMQAEKYMEPQEKQQQLAEAASSIMEQIRLRVIVAIEEGKRV